MLWFFLMVCIVDKATTKCQWRVKNPRVQEMTLIKVLIIELSAMLEIWTGHEESSLCSN